MSSHSLFAPSSAARWMACPGSLAFNEGESSNVYADDGTATHYWGSQALFEAKDGGDYLGGIFHVNGAAYVMDDERADRVQLYIDDVRRRAMGARLFFVEYRVDCSEWLTEDQGGTADCVIYQEADRHVIIEDLKDGQEKVWASEVVSYADEMTSTPEVRRVNPQLGLYALGIVRDVELMGCTVDKITVVICQPKLGSLDEFTLTYDELMEFGEEAKTAARRGLIAYGDQPNIDAYCNPGQKQCRWCQRVGCGPRDKAVEKELRAEFEDIPVTGAPIPEGVQALERAMLALPFIEDWCNAVRKKVEELVDAGTRVNGPDGLPMKFVEGRGGKRKWNDSAAAENALLAQVGPDKAYEPRKIITAPKAAKLFKGKDKKQLWKDLFEPLIQKGHGKKTLTLGSDERPEWVGAAEADDFDDIEGEGE